MVGISTGNGKPRRSTRAYRIRRRGLSCNTEQRCQTLHYLAGNRYRSNYSDTGRYASLIAWLYRERSTDSLSVPRAPHPSYVGACVDLDADLPQPRSTAGRRGRLRRGTIMWTAFALWMVTLARGTHTSPTIYVST